jgi:4-hydroxy-4-methyl-2-oxoglutarate aldolase
MNVPIGFRGFTHVPRPSADAVRRLAAYTPPDLSDAMYGAYTLDAAIRPLSPFSGRIAGPAVTVCVPQGAFNVIKFAMQQTKPGDVLVINASRIASFAVWGGNVSKGMQRRRIAGVVIDGAARDPEEAQAVAFPIFARSQATGTPLLDGPGEVNVPIACGGVVVRPGDIIVADMNGVVAVPQDAVEWVLQQVADLKTRHAGAQPILERGEVTNIEAIIQGLVQRGFAIDPPSKG